MEIKDWRSELVEVDVRSKRQGVKRLRAENVSK